ncbi:14251_t:CDS:2 [Cetraspora pellucida]|uniref:14251_t:CDS:1 n=1 Tax=Cetraspora pellucida TaxID=1433469 RepID=A0A9N9DMV7_9GLOM|nr:14251_t:CDS:2 [Cetraspora pellucida]
MGVSKHILQARKPNNKQSKYTHPKSKVQFQETNREALGKKNRHYPIPRNQKRSIRKEEWMLVNTFYKQKNQTTNEVNIPIQNQKSISRNQ